MINLKNLYQISLFVILFLFTGAMHFCAEQSGPPHKRNSEEVKKIIADSARVVLLSLKEKNMTKFAGYVHPEKGVRFSPHGYIDSENDIVFTSGKIKQIDMDSTFFWGYEDGTGDSIKLHIADYFDAYIYDANFIESKKVGYQEIIQTGNTKINISEIYPNAIFVEYHFPGTAEHDGFDWRSLRLIFEKMEETWYLVGISHDQWTI